MAVFQDQSGQWWKGPDDDVGSNRQDPGLLSRGIVRTDTGEYLRVPLTDIPYWQDEAPEPPLAPQAPAPDPEDGVRLVDHARNIMGGVAGLGQGVGWLLRQAGVEDLGGSVYDYWDDEVEAWDAGMSEAAKEQFSKDIISKNEMGEWEWGSLQTVAGAITRSIPGLVLGFGAGGAGAKGLQIAHGLTKTLQVFGNPIGRKALQEAVAKGASAAPAAAAGDVAAQAAMKAAAAASKKLKFIDRAIGVAGFGAGEGLVGGVGAGVNVYESVLKLPPEKLASNDRYQQVFNSTDEAMPYLERHQYAAETVAREASSLAGFQSGLTTAVLGAPMGAFLGSLIGKKALGAMAQTTPRAALKGAVGEAAQEFAQGGAETLIANRQRQRAGDDVELFDDVLNQALGGAVAGGVLGSAFGTLDVQPTTKPRSAGAAPASPAGKTQPKLDPLRGAAADAFKAGVPKEEILETVRKVRAGEEPVLVGVGKLRKRQMGAAQAQAAAAQQTTKAAVDSAAQEAATSPENDLPAPTPAQVEAGNFKKGKITLHGLDISIENPMGSIRKSHPDAPVQWKRMTRGGHYGYVKGTTDATGEQVDVFVGPKTGAQTVFVIDQLTPDGTAYDEPKAMVGYPNALAARRAYHANYPKGWKGLGAMTPMAMEDFKQWVKSPAAKQPVAWKPATEAASRETIPAIPETKPAPSGTKAPAVETPAAPDEAAIFNPIDVNAAPEEKVRQLGELTKANRPVLDQMLSSIDQRLGTTSKSSIKADEKILSKASRPSILKKKPWHRVEHIRDSLRGKTVIERFDQMPQVVDAIRESGAGVEVVKVDTAKLLKPDIWGWRMVALDLRMPNGQLVEHYIPITETETAKKAGNHERFERWRDRDDELTTEERRARARDIRASNRQYQAAWESALARTGEDENAVRASLDSFSAKAGSLMSTRSSPPQLTSPGPLRQAPSTLTAQKPSSPVTSTSDISGSREASTRSTPSSISSPTESPPTAESLPQKAPAPGPVAVQKSAKDRLADLLERAIRRDAMEAQGRAILDEMDEAGETPRQVATEFWNDTYPQLNDKTRRLFERQAKAMGFEPGDVLSVNADGARVTAKDWPDVGRFLAEEMPRRAEDLEGVDRGFVSLMKWANEQAAKLREQADDPSLPLLSRRAAAPGGQRAAQVRATLAKAIEEISPLVDVEVVDSLSVFDVAPEDAGAEGFFLPDSQRVVLVANNIAPGREFEVFTHEVFGHLAIERTPFGKEAVDMVLALHNKQHASIEPLWNEVATRWGRLDRVTHAKEVIAVMAERGDKHAVMTRLIAGVRRFLRKLGIVRMYSDAEVRDLIARAARALRIDVNKALAGQPKLAALNPSSSDAEILAAIDEAIPEDVVALDKHLQPALFSRAATADPSIQTLIDSKLAKAPEELTLKDKIRTIWSGLDQRKALEVKQGLIDTFASLEAMEREINGGNVMDASQSAHKAALMTKDLASQLAAMGNHGVPDYVGGTFRFVPGRKGYMEILQPLTTHKDGNLLRQYELFWAANRANRLINERNPDGTAREKLFTQAEIDTALTLEQKYPFFRDVLNDWNVFNKQMLDLAEKLGTIDPVARAVWEQNDYVPFYRAIEEAQGPRTRRGLSGQKADIRTLHGSQDKLGNVFENAMMNIAHLFDSAQRNAAMQRVVGLGIGTVLQPVPLAVEAIEFTDEQLARALTKAGLIVGNPATGQGGLPTVQAMTKQQKEHWSTLFRRVAPHGKDIVSVYVGGKPEYYEVTDPLVLASINGIGYETFDHISQMFRVSKRLLTTGVTSAPPFMLANLMRDTIANWVINGGSARHFVEVFKGIKSSLTEDPVLMQMMISGGGGGFYDANPADIRKLISSKVAAGSVNGFMDRIIDSPAKAWKAWRKIGAASENANRIARFKEVLAAGGTVAEAAYQARDVLNFSMSGDYAAMRWFVQTVPFMNARVQGLYKLYRGARDNPRAFFIRGAMILAATMALAAKNNDDPEYEELEEWDKDLYWHIFVGGKHFALPKPFEVGVIFGTLPERFWRAATGRDSGKILWDRLLHMAADTFAFDPRPQLIKPIWEQSANWISFTDSPIVGRGEQNLQPEAQFSPWTSETMRELAQAMPDWAPEWLRSPRRLEAALRAYTGTLGMYLLGMSDAAVRGALDYPQDPATKIYDHAIVRRFMRDPNPRQTKYAEQMYEMLNEANSVFSTINRYRREQRFDEAAELQTANKSKLAVRVRLNRIGTQVRNINAQIRLIQNSRTISAKEKRERIDVLVERKNKLTRQVAPWADLF